jgi:hypothetical protein
MDNLEVYQKAIDKFGGNAQTLKAIEEMAELQKELIKFQLDTSFKKNSISGITEEIADVEIMLGQLKIIFDCHDIIETVKKQKIERLEGLLNG